MCTSNLSLCSCHINHSKLHNKNKAMCILSIVPHAKLSGWGHVRGEIRTCLDKLTWISSCQILDMWRWTLLSMWQTLQVWPTALARHPTRYPDYFHSHMCATGRMPKGVSQGLWGPPCYFSARMKDISLWMEFDDGQSWFRRCAMTQNQKLTAGSWKYHQHTLVEKEKHRPQTGTFLGVPCFFSGVFFLESAVSSVSSFCLSGVGAYYGFEGGWCSWFV